MPDTLSQSHQDGLLRDARAGNECALGELLNRYRPYLGLLARLKVDRQLQARMDDSDLVQDTCLSAHRDFPQFLGKTSQEFTAWLREVMAHVAANHIRDQHRQRRDVRRERDLRQMLNESSQMLDRALADNHSSPSQGANRQERAVLLADALSQLPADYREVLVLRELEGKSLAEVAQQMDRSVNATQKLWARALLQIRRQLKALE